MVVLNSASPPNKKPELLRVFCLLKLRKWDSKAGGDVHEVHRRGQARALSERSRVSAKRFYATSET